MPVCPNHRPALSRVRDPKPIHSPPGTTGGPGSSPSDIRRIEPHDTAIEADDTAIEAADSASKRTAQIGQVLSRVRRRKIPALGPLIVFTRVLYLCS